MCGIVGYVGNRDAGRVVWDALCRLEYRGYDSAGIAVQNAHGIVTAKCKGRLKDLEAKLLSFRHLVRPSYTRWATHGVPSDGNAHPHRDCTGNIVLVHNGIIENHRELRERLLANGHKILSETDTELVAHLVEENYRGDLVDAVTDTVRELEGTMALVVIHAAEPGRIVAYREKSPLIIGLGEGENFLASDIPAIALHRRSQVNATVSQILEKDSVRIAPGQRSSQRADPS